jgi:hypothetical protein
MKICCIKKCYIKLSCTGKAKKILKIWSNYLPNFVKYSLHLDGWFIKAIFEHLGFILSMQNWQISSQLLLKPLTKFGSKFQKIFWAQSFGYGQIFYHPILLITEILISAWISQLLITMYNKLTNSVVSLCFCYE